MDVLILRVFPWGLEPRPAGVSFPVLPVGLVGLANLLRQGDLRVRGLHLPLEHMLRPDFNLERWLRAEPAAPLVLLDLHWYEHAVGVLAAARAVRAAWPLTRVVVGGMTASIFAREVLEACPQVDGVVVGDSEGPVTTLARAVVAGGWPGAGLSGLLTREGGGAARWSTPKDLFDRLDFADLGWLWHGEDYQRLLYSHPLRGPGAAQSAGRAHWVPNGRGCAYDCTFCGGGRRAQRAIFGREGLLRRAPQAVLRDVATLRGQGVEQVALTLDPDMLGPPWREAFFDGLAAPGRWPGLYLESFQLPSRSLLRGLARHGDPRHSEVALSPLSGHAGVRRAAGKHFGDDHLLRTLRELAERDLSTSVFFSLNLPGEDHETLEATLTLAERVLQDDRRGLVRVVNLCHTLDPASPLWRDPPGFGLRGAGRWGLAEYLTYGAGDASRSLREEARGLVAGRDLAAMARRWDTWCAGWPGRAVPLRPTE